MLRYWGWDVGVWVWGRRRRCGWVLGVLGVGPTAVRWGAGATAVLRLGAGGGADGGDVRGVCVSRETHVYRVAVGM